MEDQRHCAWTVMILVSCALAEVLMACEIEPTSRQVSLNLCEFAGEQRLTGSLASTGAFGMFPKVYPLLGPWNEVGGRPPLTKAG